MFPSTMAPRPPEQEFTIPSLIARYSVLHGFILIGGAFIVLAMPMLLQKHWLETSLFASAGLLALLTSLAQARKIKRLDAFLPRKPSRIFYFLSLFVCGILALAILFLFKEVWQFPRKEFLTSALFCLGFFGGLFIDLGIRWLESRNLPHRIPGAKSNREGRTLAHNYR